ncbi:hypothetical protein C0991_002180, partial [Blastosporella zonata]
MENYPRHKAFATVFLLLGEPCGSASRLLLSPNEFFMRDMARPRAGFAVFWRLAYRETLGATGFALVTRGTSGATERSVKGEGVGSGDGSNGVGQDPGDDGEAGSGLE